MKKYDPYKRLILFIASFINILLLCLLFAAGWYRYYAGTMYVITFYRRGHYVVIALYGMMLLFFSNMYGSLKIGQYRRIEVLLSQFFEFIANEYLVLFYYITVSVWFCKSVRFVPDHGSRDGGDNTLELVGDLFLQFNFSTLEITADLW